MADPPGDPGGSSRRQGPPKGGGRVGVPQIFSAVLRTASTCTGLRPLSAWRWPRGLSGVLSVVESLYLIHCCNASRTMCIHAVPDGRRPSSSTGARPLWEEPRSTGALFDAVVAVAGHSTVGKVRPDVFAAFFQHSACRKYAEAHSKRIGDRGESSGRAAPLRPTAQHPPSSTPPCRRRRHQPRRRRASTPRTSWGRRSRSTSPATGGSSARSPSTSSGTRSGGRTGSWMMYTGRAP